MKTFRRFILALIAFVALATQAAAQTTLDSTTLSAAITSTTAETISLASTSDVSVGEVLFVDREAMLVRTVTPTVTVTRGYANTRPAIHGSGALVYVEVAGAYYSDTPAIGSACERTNERYLPHVVLPSGEVWDCPTSSDVWVYLNDPAAITVPCRALLVADQIDQTCFIADRNYVVTKIQEIHTTAESGGTLTLIPRRQQGTEAPASGDALATAIDMVGAGAVAQTLKTATLTTTTANLLINAGDRLALDFTDDTAGELAGVVVTFQLSPR